MIKIEIHHGIRQLIHSPMKICIKTNKQTNKQRNKQKLSTLFFHEAKKDLLLRNTSDKVFRTASPLAVQWPPAWYHQLTEESQCSLTSCEPKTTNVMNYYL